MPRAVPLARRNLFCDRRRLLLAVGGVGVAMLLVLVLDGIFTGSMRQVTGYIDDLPADIIVSQKGVRTMHMSSSAVDADVADRARDVPGVAWVDTIYYTTTVVRSGSQRQLTYVIGYDVAANRSGPRQLVSGGPPGPGQVVLDETAAQSMGVNVGDTVTLLGHTYVLSGLTTGRTSIVNTTTFMSADDYKAVRPPAVSYVLVGTDPGISPETVRRNLAEALPGATVQTRAEFSRQEAQIVRDMAADVMQIMTIIGFLIALAVVGLTLFALTLAKLREYAVAKALGASGRHLGRTVIAQGAWIVVLALVVAVVATFVLAAVVGALTPKVSIVVALGSVVRTAMLGLAVGALGSVTPLRRIMTVDPASVF